MRKLEEVTLQQTADVLLLQSSVWWESQCPSIQSASHLCTSLWQPVFTESANCSYLACSNSTRSPFFIFMHCYRYTYILVSHTAPLFTTACILFKFIIQVHKMHCCSHSSVDTHSSSACGEYNYIVLQASDSKGIIMMRVPNRQGSLPDALHVGSTCFSTRFFCLPCDNYVLWTFPKSTSTCFWYHVEWSYLQCC